MLYACVQLQYLQYASRSKYSLKGVACKYWLSLIFKKIKFKKWGSKFLGLKLKSIFIEKYGRLYATASHIVIRYFYVVQKYHTYIPKLDLRGLFILGMEKLLR